MEKKKRAFAVFYRDYVHDVSISSASPEMLAEDRIASLLSHLLHNEENYLGIEDGTGSILQFFLDGDKVMAELLYPESQSCLRASLSMEDALALVNELPDEFNEAMLPGAKYVTY